MLENSINNIIKLIICEYVVLNHH